MRGKTFFHAGLVAGLLWSALAGMGWAQEAGGPWRILSPAPDTLLPDGSVFVVVRLAGGQRLDPASARVYVDGLDLTREAKASERTVRLLYPGKLGAGTHEVAIEAEAAGGKALPALRWTFRVQGGGAGETSPRPPRVSARRFAFSGTTLLDTKTSDFSGRRDLRQEPLRTYVLQADVEGRYGAFTFPVRLFLTTDEDARTQPRNRFLFGVRSEHLTLLFGDNTPFYNPLIVDGVRTRGVLGEVAFRPVSLSGVYGQLRRGIDPGLFDGVTRLPGTYARMLAAARLSVGSERSVRWGLDVSRARDDQGSIDAGLAEASGLAPMENLVVGSDLSLRLLQGRFRLEGGAALSITTEDAGRGPATKARIDSLFDTNIPIDPADYDWLITFNTTTVPLRLDRLSSLAWYVQGRVAASGHTLTASWQHVGEAYVSFANPFLLNDRRTLTLTDRFKMFGGRLTGMLSYRHYGTPPRDETLRSTLEADLFAGQVAVSPWRRPTWLFVSTRLQNRRTTAEGTGNPQTDTRLTSFTVGGYHLARTGGFQHGLNLSYTYTDRSDDLQPALNSVTRSLTVGLSEQFPRPFYLNLQLTRLKVTSGDQGDLQNLTTVSGSVGYRMERPALDLSMAIQNVHQAEVELIFPSLEGPLLLPGSDRTSFTLRGAYRLHRDMELEVQLGYDTYRGQAEYTDRYVVLRHRYTF